MPSLTDLIAAPSTEELQTKLFELLRLAGFPAHSWHRFSIPRHLSENEPLLLEDLWTSCVEVTKGGFTSLAVNTDGTQNGWLDLIAENFYSDSRKPAVATVGKIRVTDSGGVGPVNIAANALIVSTPDNATRFIATTGGTVPLNGSLTLSVVGESAGASFNVANGAIDTLVTSIPGLTVTNPAQATGTWIDTQGADTESDGELSTRLQSKWGTLGTCANDSSYRYHALASSSECRKVRAYSPVPGTVRVVVAGASGPLGATGLAAAVAAIEAMRPLAVSVTTVNVTANTVIVNASLSIAPGADGVTARAKAIANVAAYATALDIGARVSYEKIVEALVSAPGVTDATITAPTADIVQTDEQVFVPTVTVT